MAVLYQLSYVGTNTHRIVAVSRLSGAVGSRPADTHAA